MAALRPGPGGLDPLLGLCFGDGHGLGDGVGVCLGQGVDGLVALLEEAVCVRAAEVREGIDRLLGGRRPLFGRVGGLAGGVPGALGGAPGDRPGPPLDRPGRLLGLPQTRYRPSFDVAVGVEEGLERLGDDGPLLFAQVLEDPAELRLEFVPGLVLGVDDRLEPGVDRRRPADVGPAEGGPERLDLDVPGLAGEFDALALGGALCGQGVPCERLGGVLLDLEAPLDQLLADLVDWRCISNTARNGVVASVIRITVWRTAGRPAPAPSFMCPNRRSTYE